MTDVTPPTGYDPDERFVEPLLEDAERDRAEVAVWRNASPPIDDENDDEKGGEG